MILTVNDFVGIWQIPINGINNTILQNTIEESEKKWLTTLLGDDLYYNLVQGLEETSPLTKWISLRDGLNYKYEADLDDSYVYANFRGLKKMLLYFTWVDFMILTRHQVNIVGMQTPNVENGTTTPNVDFAGQIESMFNEGLNVYYECVTFIMRMNFDTEIVSINGVNVTVNYAKLFEGGESVAIGGLTYDVEAVNGNVIELNAEPQGSTITYLFYRNFIHTPIKKASSF